MESQPEPELQAADFADVHKARLGILLYRVVGSLEIMLCPQIYNTAIRRGEIGSFGWDDQW